MTLRRWRLLSGAVAACLAASFVVPSAQADPDDTVEFASPNLQWCVQDALGLWSWDPVTIGAMETLTSLECLGFTTSVAELALAVNLEALSLRSGEADDWESLSSLRSLRELNLEATNVSSLEWLAGAESLTDLNVSRTSVTDLSPIAELPLTRLTINNLALTDLDFLEGDETLAELNFTSNEVDDISVLTTLPSLTAVNFDSNRVVDVSPLAEVPGLTSWSAHSQRGTLPPIEACVQHHGITGGIGIDGSTYPLLPVVGVFNLESFVLPTGTSTLSTRNAPAQFSAYFEVEAYGHSAPCPWPAEYLATFDFPNELTVGELASIARTSPHVYGVTTAYRWRLDDGTSAANTYSVRPLEDGIGRVVTPSASISAPGMETITTTGPALTITGVLPEDIGLRFAESPAAGVNADALPWISVNGASWSCEWILDGVSVAADAPCSWPVPKTAAGKSLVVRATLSKENYHERTYESAPATILRYDWKVSGTGTISGTPDVGKSLTAVAPTFSPSATSYSYVWMRDSWAIDGAESRTYALTAADAGHRISVVIYGERAGYLRTSVETPMVTVKRYFTSTPTPTISGTKAVGLTMTVSRGTWSPAASSYSYQWYRDGKAISGATKSSYKATTSDGGRKITVRVWAKRSGYTTAYRTSASVTVLKSFTSKPTPTISGTAKVKSTLTVRTGTWGPGTVTKSYQWYRNGKAISGATKSTYKISVKDAYAKITVKVTGTKSGYAKSSRTSASKTPVGIKYSSCTTLRKDYPGGIAKSSSTKGIRSTTYISSSLYSLNSSRDGDKDGWACE